MAPPPPSQAGRFKPRKPAKKIRVGESTGGASTTITSDTTAPASAASAAASGASSSSRSTRPSSGGAGGRGGRGGRGARAPVQQGRAFFEAAPKPSATTSSSGASRSGATTGRMGASAASGTRGGRGTALTRRDPTAQEEIVGFLEEGVGASAAAKAKASKGSLLDRLEDEEEGATSPEVAARKPLKTTNATSADDFYFDDDSSDDDGKEVKPLGTLHRSNTPRLQPIVLPASESADLPEPSVALPEEVPSHGKSAHNLPVDPVPSLTTQLRGTKVVTDEADPRLAIPEDEWMFVQLPTRLPPLQSVPQPPPEPVSSASLRGSEDGAVPVNLPSVRADRFDHSLVRAVPGRLGRLAVYKSGRMELLLEGPDGEPTVRVLTRWEDCPCSICRMPIHVPFRFLTHFDVTQVRMNVTGHRCGCLQQAVSVDLEKEKLVLLGSVQHSIVVTPDLSGI